MAQAALAAGASWLGVCTLEEALELRAGGIDAPVLSWLHLPDEDFAPAIRAGVDLGVSSRAHLAGVLAGARRGGAPGPAAPEDRHRADPQRRRPRRVGPAARRRGPGHRGRDGRGGRRLVAPGPGRRPRAPDQRPPGRPAHRGVAGGVRARAAPDPAPGELRGHHDPPRPALRPGPRRHRRLRARPAGPPGRGRRAPAGDDAAGAGGAGQAGAGRRGRVLRARVDDPAGDDARAAPDRLRRRGTAAAGRRRADAGAAGRGPASGRRPGLHGPDRRGLRRRRRPRGRARRAVRSG